MSGSMIKDEIESEFGTHNTMTWTALDVIAYNINRTYIHTQTDIPQLVQMDCTFVYTIVQVDTPTHYSLYTCTVKRTI